MNEYKHIFINRPWISGNIKHTYISEVSEIYTDVFNTYIVKDEYCRKIKTKDGTVCSKETKDGTVWYSVNNLFYILETDKNIFKVQEGDILSFYYHDKECYLQVKLGFLMVDIETMFIQENFIVQDENIYKEEKKYFEKMFRTLNEVSVSAFLEEKMKAFSVEEIGYYYLTKNFEKFDIKYSIDDIFKNFIDSETTIKEYATYVFSIITFIDNYSICDNIFLKRLKKKYYKAEEILNLTLEEKIPEILCNDDEYRKKIKYYIDAKIMEDVYKFGEVAFIKIHEIREYKKRNFDILDTYELSSYVKINTVCDEIKNI